MKHISEEYISKPNEELSVEQRVQAGAQIFLCRGAFSLVNHARLKQVEAEIAAAVPNRIVLDLSEIGFVDSSGLGTLAAVLKKTMEQGKELALVANPTVRKTIATAGLEKVFQIFDSLDDALRTPSR
jgi:anti-sigma B factor antagonist